MVSITCIFCFDCVICIFVARRTIFEVGLGVFRHRVSGHRGLVIRFVRTLVSENDVFT